jgi:hypothetical protein
MDKPDIWITVAQPDAVFAWMPFVVEQCGRRFRPAAGFDLLTHTGLAMTKAYYVDRGTGSDANAGTSWATALKTITAAAGKTDVDVIYVRNGMYYKSECGLGTRSLALIGDSTALLTSSHGNYMGVPTKVDNHYEIVFTNYSYMSRVEDILTVDSTGRGSLLTARSTIAQVDANPGSYWYNYTGGASNTLYIRLADDRLPDATTVLYLDTGPFVVTADNRVVYLEGFRVYGGGMTFRNASVVGGFKVYAKGLYVLGAWTLHGLQECILQNCQVYATGDGINYDARYGVVTRAVEINVKVENTSTAADSQATTGHNACQIVRLNGRYGPVGGQCVGDVTGCQAWLLGCWMTDSTVAGVGHYLGGSGAQAWLDCCATFEISSLDLQNEVGATTYIRNFVGSRGVNGIAGTLASY